MECLCGLLTVRRSLLTLHVQGNPCGDGCLGANAVDGFLHLAVTAVAALHGVGCRGQQFVIEKRQRLLQVGGEQLLQRLADPLEAANPPPQPCQFVQRGVGSAATVEEAVHLVHDLAQRSQFGPPAGDAVQLSPLSGSQAVSDEQVTMLEQLTHLPIDPLTATGRPAGYGCRRASATEFRLTGRQFLADFGHGTQHRFGQFLDDVKLATLVRHVAKYRGNRLRIQVRTVGRDALQFQAALLQQRLKPAEETLDVGVRGIMVQHLEGDSPERAVVDDREHAERAVVFIPPPRARFR